MNRIEAGLHEHHTALQQSQATQMSSSQANATNSPRSNAESQSQVGVAEIPFAKVNSVADGSPASTAGLKAGDGIRSFGDINWTNHENLKRVADVVQRHEGVRHLYNQMIGVPLTACSSDRS